MPARLTDGGGDSLRQGLGRCCRRTGRSPHSAFSSAESLSFRVGSFGLIHSCAVFAAQRIDDSVLISRRSSPFGEVLCYSVKAILYLTSGAIHETHSFWRGGATTANAP